MKAAIEREQSQTRLNSVEREQTRPKFKAAIEREQSQTRLNSVEREQTRAKLILYHGSNVEIDAIDFEKSKPGKDFGVAFT